MVQDKLTPTQQRLMTILGDGMAHSREQLLGTIGDASIPNLQMHLSLLRKVLRPSGQDVVCVRNNGDSYYRWIRYLSGE